MSAQAPARKPWLLPAVVAALVTVIGPAAGSLVLAVLAFLAEVFAALRGDGSGHVGDMLLGVPWFFAMGYVFGTVPALVGGIVLGLYMYLTGRQPWIAGLVIGAVAPPLCLAAIGASGLHDAPLDADWLRDVSKMAMFTGGLGFSAALVTAGAIRFILRRQLAAHSVRT